jgi:hypothetical protein
MSARHPTPWTIQLGDNGKRGKARAEWASILDANGVFVAEGLDESTAKEIVFAVNGDVQKDEVKAVLARMKQKEDAFWTCDRPRIGTFAVALLLDGFRTDIEIAIGEYPRPKGKAANTREAK